MAIHDSIDDVIAEPVPCPFCGQKELERNDSVFWTGMKNEVTRYRIQHNCKDAQGRIYRRIEVGGTTLGEMVAAWNTRHAVLSPARATGCKMANSESSARKYGAVALFTKLQAAIANDGIDLRTATKSGPVVTKLVNEIVAVYFDKPASH